MLSNSFLEILHIFCMILFQFMDFSSMGADEIFDLSKDQTAMQRKLLKHPEYQEILKKELPRLIGTGILG